MVSIEDALTATSVEHFSFLNIRGAERLSRHLPLVAIFGVTISTVVFNDVEVLLLNFILVLLLKENLFLLNWLLIWLYLAFVGLLGRFLFSIFVELVISIVLLYHLFRGGLMTGRGQRLLIHIISCSVNRGTSRSHWSFRNNEILVLRFLICTCTCNYYVTIFAICVAAL